jgi:hypothetical protein
MTTATCMAVGITATSADVDITLVERWHG